MLGLSTNSRWSPCISTCTHLVFYYAPNAFYVCLLFCANLKSIRHLNTTVTREADLCLPLFLSGSTEDRWSVVLPWPPVFSDLSISEYSLHYLFCGCYFGFCSSELASTALYLWFSFLVFRRPVILDVELFYFSLHLYDKILKQSLPISPTICNLYVFKTRINKLNLT